MKVVIPFKVPHDVDPREDYFELCRDVGKGSFVSTQDNGTFDIIKKIRGENVHAHGRGLPFPELSSLFAKKSIYTPHNNHFGASKFTQFFRSIIFNRYTWIAAQTEYGKRNYIKQGADSRKIVVLPIPINYKFFSRPKGAKSFRKKFGLGNEPFVLCVNARRTKNPEIIIEACKKSGIRLVFISRKSKKEVKPGFEWMLPEKKILNMESKDVIFTGNISKKDMLGALDAAAVFVNSSDDGGECFSLSVYEAAASGIPLCLPDFGVFEIFKGSALFHNNHNSKQLSKNISKYMETHQLRQINSKKAKEIAKRFDYPIVRNMYEIFYRNIGFIGDFNSENPKLSDNMKIANVYPFPVPIGRNKPKLPGNTKVGGGETYPFRLSLRLSDARNDVTYFTGKLPGIIDNKIEVNKMKVVYCPIYMFRNLIYHAISIKLFFKLLFGNYDVYTSWQIPTIFSITTGIVAKMKRKRFIVNHIGLIPDISKSTRFYTKIVAKLADNITMPNKFCKRFFKKYFDEKNMLYIPYAIDISNFQRTIDKKVIKKYKMKGEKIVLYVGRLVANKGLDVLIDSIKLLVKKNKNIKLVIVGKGNLENYLRKYVKETGLEKNVIFAGFIYEDLPKYYSMADVTVLPSVYKDRFGNRYPEPEAFGLVLAESMSCGTPIVATKVGGIPYWIRHNFNGLLVKPSNVSDLANNINKILKNKRLSEKIVKNARKELRNKYSLDVVLENYIDILKNT